MKTDDLISMVLILGVIPVTIVLVLFFIQKAKHKERMTLIEKGIHLDTKERKPSPFQDVLMWGMLAGGMGLGLLIAYLLLEMKVFIDDMILGIMAMIFGGISLISYYVIKRRIDKK